MKMNISRFFRGEIMKLKKFVLTAVFLLALLNYSALAAQSTEKSVENSSPAADSSDVSAISESQETQPPTAATASGNAVQAQSQSVESAGKPSDCSTRCESYCSCSKRKGGGGPVMLLIFNRYNNSKYGDVSGPTLWYGGRGYGYIFDNRIRLGGMGAGGAGPADDGYFASQGSDAIYYPFSKSRRISGGYGGFTAEYVFNSGKYLEFPMGALLGFGYGGYSAELEPKNVFSEGVTTTYFENGPFIALQPMVGVEVNALQWLKIQLSASYLFAKPFNATSHLGGFTMVFGLMFGRFWPDEWKMPEENSTESASAVQ